MPDPHTRARAALQRALSIDSGYGAARVLIAHMDALAAQPPTRVPAYEDAGPLTPFTRWRTAVARRDGAALRRLRDTLSSLGPVNLRAIALASQYDAVSLADGDGAVRALRARATRTSDRLEAALAEHSLALNEGRIRDALTAADRIGVLQPASHAHLRLRVLDALYGNGSTEAAEDAAARLDAATASSATSASDPRGVQLADACVIGQWRLARGDSTGVRGIVAQLRAGALNAPGVAVASTPAACAELLEAKLAVTTRATDAAARVARVDSLAFTDAASGDASTYAPLLIARLHEQLGDVPGALRAIRRRAYMSAWPRYLAAALREEGKYAAAVGATDVFREAGTRYLALRAAPDSALHAEVDEVRRSVVLPPVEAIR
jgi:hypothetical protein